MAKKRKNAYPARDVAGTRKWYEEMLGLTFGTPYAPEGVEQYNGARIGNGYFSLMNAEWVGREPGSASSIVFEVDDIEVTAKSLREKGVTVEDIYETPVCKISSFNDPDGNKVSLHQITVPH